MDAAFVESFFCAAMKEEPLDYYEYSYVEKKKEDDFKVKDESNSSELFNFADVHIKQEILDEPEPEDYCVRNAFVETAEVQHYTDHTYANLSLDNHIKVEPTDQMKTENLAEENIQNFADITNIINNLGSSPSTSLTDEMIREEIIFDFPIYDGLHEFHDFVDKTNIKVPDLVIDRTKNDYTKFLKNKQLDEVAFKCKHCYYTFNSFSELQIHTQKHFIRNCYKCKNCINEFATLTDLLKHELTHLGGKVYSCSLCKNIYFTISSYKHHLKWHICANCNKVFTKKNMRIAHQQKCKIKENVETKTKENIINGQNSYDRTLTILDYSSIGNSSESCIENIPQNIFKRQCKYCSNIFQNEVLLEDHVQNDHYGKELFQCDYCNEKFPSERDKIKHMIIHRREFRKKTTKIGNLNYNQEIKLKRKCLANMPSSDEQGKKIKLSENLIINDQLVDKSETFFQEFPLQKEIIIPLVRCDIDNLRCKICKKIFINSKVKNLHVKNHKLHILCKVCSEFFMSRKALKAHMRDHNEQRIYECDICDETFQCLKEQENHALKHSAFRQGKFNCDICDKVFISQSTYKRHMYIHRP